MLNRLSSIARPQWLLSFAAALTLSCADIDSRTVDGWRVADEPTQGPASIEPATTVSPVSRLECSLEASHFAETWWVEPHYHGFVPNESLFVAGAGFNGDAVSLSIPDGGAFRTNDLQGLRSVDRDWAVGAVVQYPESQVLDLNTREALATLEGDVSAAAMSRGGDRAAFVVCGEETTELVLLNLDDSTRRSIAVSAGAPCYTWSNAMNRAAFTDDGELVVFTVMDGTVWSVDTTTFEATQFMPHVPPEDSFYETVVMDMAIRPGSHEVATTGIDGMLRRWSLDDLSPTAEPIEVGTFRINEQTYAPQYTVSPLAYSPDGATIAFTDLDGNIVVRNDAGDSVLQSPPAPQEFMDWARTGNVPVTITFGPSGRRIGVGYYWGPGVWGCPGGEITRTGRLVLDVPSVASADSSGAVEIPLTLVGAGPLTAIRVATATHELDWYSLQSGRISFWQDPTDVQDVTIEADDGLGRATATVRIQLIR